MNRFGKEIGFVAHVTKRQFSGKVKYPPPRMFDHDTIVENIKPCKEIVDLVESSYEKLWKNEVENPEPLRVCIPDIDVKKPYENVGESQVSAGYIEGEPTWTVKLESVNFRCKESGKKLPKSGLYIVYNAANGQPHAILQENRYLHHLRTGAAGAVAVKHFAGQGYHHVAFIGTGSNATSMALATHHVHRFEAGYAYGLDKARTQAFANEIYDRCGYRVLVCDSAEEAVRNAEVVFTQTPSATPVFEASWLKPHATVIASGSDHRLKNQLPLGLLKNCKYVTDLTAQCAASGELRTGLQFGMTVDQVYAELGEVVAGAKPGRVRHTNTNTLEDRGDGVILVDLSLAATGAQDAAVGQYAWEVLRQLK